MKETLIATSHYKIKLQGRLGKPALQLKSDDLISSCV